MINLEYYRAFYAVAKHKKLTTAAKELFVSQPALSQTMKNLEEQLGGQLFVRTPKGVELTPEGAKLYEFIEQGLNSFDMAEKSFDEMKNLKAGNIRIGASDTLCKYYLLDKINIFHETYPEIGIQVTNRTSHETAALLMSGMVEIGFVNLPINTAGLDIKECMSITDCFVVSKKYRAYSDKPMNLEQIITKPLIMMERLSNTRQFFDAFLLSKGYKITPAFELGSFDMVVEFAKSGLGIGCVTREFVVNEFLSGDLYELPIDFELPKRAIGSVLKKNTPLTFAADKFMELILTAI